MTAWEALGYSTAALIALITLVFALVLIDAAVDAVKDWRRDRRSSRV